MKNRIIILMMLLVAPIMAQAEVDTYTYKATIVSVYDGDTVTADIDLGLRFNIERLVKREVNGSGCYYQNAERQKR